MKKWNKISLMLAVIFILGITGWLSGSADYSNFKGRAISLKILQKQVKDCLGEGSMPTTLYNLCGITKIHGYIIDEAHKDIILIGSIDREKPPLYLDDFVIALRNAWMKYTESKGNINYYSNPGCSIDPDPTVMGKLDEIGNRLKESQSNEQIESVLRQWENTCNMPQKVRVMGIPFNSHFASVMVKADYDMKRIADGSDELNLLWFSTLADLQMDEAKRQYIHGHTSSEPLGGMDRFWFYPGELGFLEDGNAVMIETCKVKLLTEEEHLTSQGDISGTGGSNPIAEKFANDFTDFYPEVAAQRPIYLELENLFRFVALAKVMKLKAPHEKVGLSLQYLLEQYPVSEKNVDTSLPGRSNVNCYKRQRESAEGTQAAQLWLPSCGGVTMDYNMGDKDPMLYHDRCILKKITEEAVEERMFNDDLSWNFGASSNDKYSATVLLDSAGAYLQGHMAILLYSPTDGYYYCSHSAYDSDNIVEKIDNKEEFKKLVNRYNWGFKTTISDNQFNKMKTIASSIVKNHYNGLTNNCAHFVQFVLSSGQLNPGNRETRPDDYMCEVIEKNKGSVIFQPESLWK